MARKARASCEDRTSASRAPTTSAHSSSVGVTNSASVWRQPRRCAGGVVNAERSHDYARFLTLSSHRVRSRLTN